MLSILIQPQRQANLALVILLEKRYGWAVKPTHTFFHGDDRFQKDHHLFVGNEILTNDQVPSVEDLLNRFDPIPIAGEPQTAIFIPQRDPDRIAVTRLAIVIQVNL